MPVNDIHNDIAHHVLVIDGAMGTMIQRRGLSESDFRGKAFTDSLCRLQGANSAISNASQVLTAVATGR